MRRLMYLAIGFAIACGVCAYADDTVWCHPAAGALVLILCMVGTKRWLRKKLMLASLGCVLGFFWFGQYRDHYLDPITAMDSRDVLLTIRAVDYGSSWKGFAFFDGTVSVEDNTYLVHTRLKEDIPVEPGMNISGVFHISTAVGGTSQSGKGSFLYAYQKEEITITRSEPEWYDKLASWRRDIKKILQDTFPEDTYPFAKALLLGDTSDIGYAVDTDLKISGVRHVVAVSGLHISILFGFLSAVTFRRRFLTAMVGYPVLFFFAALTGFSPSVVRSCLMWALVLLAKLSDREYDGPTALSFAVLVMLFCNPLVITAVGFQLSVASVAGIYLFTSPILLWLRSFFGEIKGKSVPSLLIRWSTASVAVTLGACVMTTPLCAYYFGMVSLVGVLTNLLSLWIVSGIFYGIMAVLLVFLLLPSAGQVLAALIAWPVRYVLWVAEIMADVPLAAVYTASPYITAWLVFVYAMLAVFLVLENRKPYVLCCCAVIGFCMALSADWSESMDNEVRITVLDVGQGQSILLQSEGRSFLVDCGGEYAADRAAEALLIQGIRKLDGLILTHLDEDHAGGAEDLLARMDVALLVLPDEYSDLPSGTDARLICAMENTHISFGESSITVYPPTFPGNSNEKSLCVLFDTKKCDILITGDRDGYGERSLLRNADIPDVDVLIAGHHGAASSTCEELLTAVKPEIVCISVGADNFYGHPAPELLQRLAAYGCDIYRTDIQGTITIRR